MPLQPSMLVALIMTLQHEKYHSCALVGGDSNLEIEVEPGTLSPFTFEIKFLKILELGPWKRCCCCTLSYRLSTKYYSILYI